MLSRACTQSLPYFWFLKHVEGSKKLTMRRRDASQSWGPLDKPRRGAGGFSRIPVIGPIPGQGKLRTISKTVNEIDDVKLDLK